MFIREPLVSIDTLVNRNEESLNAMTERIGKFLKGGGLKLTERNVEKYFKYKLREPVSKRTITEIFNRLKESKWWEPVLEKRGEEALKKILGRKRISVKQISKKELELLKSKLKVSESDSKSAFQSKKRKRISGKTKHPIKQTEVCPECGKLMHYMEDTKEMFCLNCGNSKRINNREE